LSSSDLRCHPGARSHRCGRHAILGIANALIASAVERRRGGDSCARSAPRRSEIRLRCFWKRLSPAPRPP
jgi:hypothetical protein